MKSFLSAIVLVQLFHLNGATAAPPVSEQALNNRVPLLQASEVVESAKSFLAKERRLDMKKFKLSHLSFTYYSEWMATEKNFNGEWSVSFALAGSLRAVDSDITVYVTNEKKPAHKIGMGP